MDFLFSPHPMNVCRLTFFFGGCKDPAPYPLFGGVTVPEDTLKGPLLGDPQSAYVVSAFVLTSPRAFRTLRARGEVRTVGDLKSPQKGWPTRIQGMGQKSKFMSKCLQAKKGGKVQDQRSVKSVDTSPEVQGILENRKTELDAGFRACTLRL